MIIFIITQIQTQFQVKYQEVWVQFLLIFLYYLSKKEHFCFVYHLESRDGSI
jgi:hypothetical protein